MGDDINDLAAINLAGFSAAPADAHESIRSIVKLVTAHPGGHGAVRDLLDHLNLGT
jgi:3-deoxy-D-manno-octulosonate 8-phosphate phosphatase KdsC-like HAD superfamily phosphatase